MKVTLKVTLNLVRCKDEKPPRDGRYFVCDMYQGEVWYTTATYYTERNGWNTTNTDASHRLAYEEDDDKYWAKEVLIEDDECTDALKEQEN